MNELLFKGNVIAHGIDIVETSRFEILLNKLSHKYLNRYFTRQELDTVGDGALRAEKLASRFAIKEAVLKALNTGWGNGVSFEDVEVFNSAIGAPSVKLHRRLMTLSERKKITHWLVSASHAGSMTMAIVIGLSDGIENNKL